MPTSKYAVLSCNWEVGSIGEELAGKGWFWALGVGTPFDPDKVKMHGSGVESLDEAKRQFQVARDKWFEWADLSERQRANVSFHCWFRLALAGRFCKVCG